MLKEITNTQTANTSTTTDEEIKAQALQAVAAYTQGRDLQRVVMVRRNSNILVNIVIGM